MVAFTLDRIGAESVIEALTGGAQPEDDDILSYSLARGWQFEQPTEVSTDPHTHVQADITDWPLTVARGGTGFASLTSGNLSVGAGTSPMTALAYEASGGYVRSNGSAWVRNSGIPAEDVNPGTFGGTFIFSSQIVASGGLSANDDIEITGGNNLVFASQGDIVMPSNDSLALEIKTSSDLHFRFITTTGSQKIQAHQDLELLGAFIFAQDLFEVGSNTNVTAILRGKSNRPLEDDVLFALEAQWNGTLVADILFEAGPDTINKDEGKMRFRTAGVAGSMQTFMTADNLQNIVIGLGSLTIGGGNNLIVSGVTTLTGGLNTPLIVTQGGTGLSLWTDDGVTIGNAGASPTFVTGANGQYLRRGVSTWEASTLQVGDLPEHTHPTSDIASGIFTVPFGGTGLGTVATGGVLIGESTSAFSVALAGSDGGILRSNGTRYVRVSGLATSDITSGSFPTSRTDAKIIAVTVGTGLDVSAGGSPNITLDFFELDPSGTLVGGDDLVVVDHESTHRTQISTIPLSIFLNDAGYSSGDIDRVFITAGNGITGTVDTTYGDHTQTLSLDFANMSVISIGTLIGEDHLGVDDAGITKRARIDQIDVGIFNDDGTYSLAGHSQGASTITSGTFGAGNYVFPAALSVAGTITSTVTGDILVYNENSTLKSAIVLANTSGRCILGAESSAGGAIFAGTDAYSTVLGNGVNRAIHLVTNDIVRMTIAGGGEVTFLGTVVAVQDLNVNGTFTLTAVPEIDFQSAGKILMVDNNALALQIMQGANPYIRFITTDGGEKVQVVQNLEAQGTLNVTGNTTLTLELYAADGGEATPGIAFNNSKGTGLWRPGADILAGSTAGVEAFRFDASQNATFTGTLAVTGGNLSITTGDLLLKQAGNNRIIADSGVRQPLFYNASSHTFEDGDVTIDQNLTISGNHVQISDATGNPGASVRFLGSNTTKNFLVGNQFNLSGIFEITPSTTNGGSTFTTPAFKINSSGNTTITGALSITGNVTSNAQSDWPVFDHGTGKTANWSIDANDGNIQEVLISGSTADLTAINNWSEGSPLHIFVKWGGDFGATFDMTMVDWGSAGEPGWSSQAAKTDWVMLIKNGTKIYGAGAVGFTS